MTNNMIQLAEKMSPELEKTLVQAAATGLFADNVLRAKFVGAKTVLIPEMDMAGLGDYSRDTGYPVGSVTITDTPYTLKMDRGRSFSIDAQDEDESGIAGLAGKFFGEFTKAKVAPELDAYVLSQLASYAKGAGQTVAVPDGSTFSASALSMILTGINDAGNEIGFDEELVVFVSPFAYNALMTSSELSSYISVGDFRRGGVDVKVKMINGVPIIPVPESRLYLAYNFNNGVDAGQENGGFSPLFGVQKIGFVVAPRKGGSLVKKAEKMRVFAPSENQLKDAWQFNYRLYYDFFVKKSYLPGVRTYTAASFS